MKKIFKGLSVLVAATALCAGVATATACSGGYNGTYTGEYHYVNYGVTYGMVVEVSVENNIITKVTDVTNTDNDYAKSVQVDADGNAATWTTVSPGWLDYYLFMCADGKQPGSVTPDYKTEEDGSKTLTNGKEIEAIMPTDWYGWSNEDATKWPTYENWLLQQYVGWSVADVLDISVYYNANGEPYRTKEGYNAELLASGLLISNSTQSSGRLLLAVQNALSK